MLNPTMLKTCGVIGLPAALLTLPADVLSWFLAEHYSPIRQTISALAVGPSSWLIDLGIWAFALACMVVGFGLLLLDLRAGLWRVAALAAMGTGVAAAVIAQVNEYAGQENSGANVHTWAVVVIYVLFAVAAVGSQSGLKRLSPYVADYSRLAGGAWIVLAPIYYFWFPSGWAGAFERALALLMIVWLALVAQRLRREEQLLSNAV